MNIKFLSYNIQSWDVTDRRIKGIFDLIKRHNPDIICFQEVTVGWYSLLKKDLGDKYTLTGRDRFFGDKTRAKRYFERNCVAFKKNRFRPIKCRTYWLGPDMYNPSHFEGAGLNRIFTTAYLLDKKTNKKILAISTHFDDRLPDVRAKQAVVLSNFINEQKVPLLLMGDFNSEPTEEAYKTIRNSAIDIGEELGVTDDTYHGYNQHPSKRIDFAFRNNKIKPKSIALVKDCFEELPPSDHYPIECIIKK